MTTEFCVSESEVECRIKQSRKCTNEIRKVENVKGKLYGISRDSGAMRRRLNHMYICLDPFLYILHCPRIEAAKHSKQR